MLYHRYLIYVLLFKKPWTGYIEIKIKLTDGYRFWEYDVKIAKTFCK